MQMWLTMTVILALVLPGCVVSQSKYDAALSDMESAKTELEKTRMQRDALGQQLKNLKGVNEKLSTDLEMMSVEVQRIKEGRKSEQALLDARENELDQVKQELMAKYQAVHDQYQQAKNKNKALKETVLRYQKELKEARAKKMARLSVPSQKPGTLSSPPTLGKSQSTNLPTPATTKKNPAALININKASVRDLEQFLGLTRKMAEDVVANRPYSLRGQLVAKKVVPKATFDRIKNRITARR